MKIKNCARCNKIFKAMSSAYCPMCMKMEEEDYRKVDDYLLAHSGTSVMDVHEATGVDEKVILRLIRDGRLKNSPADAEMSSRCETCGHSISPGARLCSNCIRKFSDGLSKATAEASPSVKRDSMHTLKYIKGVKK